MNLHLFLDVVAWINGPLFSIICLWAAYRWFVKAEGDAAIGGCLGAIIATLCWAWIIAG